MKTLSALVFFLLIFFNSQGQTKTFNILDFEAKPGLSEINTVQIQKAIDAAGKNGGTVLIPDGRFITGSLELKSNVMLFLTDHAELLGSTNRLDYGYGEAQTLIWARDRYSCDYLSICLLPRKKPSNISLNLTYAQIHKNN